MQRGAIGPILVALLAILASPLSAAEEPEAMREVSHLERVRVLLGSLGGRNSVSPDVVVERLVEMGKAAPPALFELRDEFSGERHQDVIARTLVRLGNGRLETYLLAMVHAAKDRREREVALRNLGRHATPRIFPGLVKCMEQDPYRTGSVAGEALTAVLGRNPAPETYLRLEPLLDPASEVTRAHLVIAIADARTTDGLDLLGRLLGRHHELDPVIAAGIARMPAGTRAPLVAAKLRDMLDSGKPPLQKECALALGRLEDAESVAVLVKLLGGDHAGVAANAHWALKTITRRGFPADAERWCRWYEEEEEWWRVRGQALLDTLETNDAVTVLEAIRLLSQRVLHRDQIAEALERLVTHGNAAIARAASAALVQLGLAEETEVPALVSISSTYSPPEKEKTVRSAGPSAPPVSAASTSSTFVPLYGVGAVVLLWLALRITGLWNLDWLRRRFAGRAT